MAKVTVITHHNSFHNHHHCDDQPTGIHVIWALLIIVGASSAYFHATLSLLGQVSLEMSSLFQPSFFGSNKFFARSQKKPSLLKKYLTFWFGKAIVALGL